MNTKILHLLGWLALLFLLAGGCASKAPTTTDHRVVGMGLAARDGEIGDAAVRIGTNNAAAPDSPQKPLIAADVAVIEAALTKLPAAEVAKALASLASERDAARKEATTWRLKTEEAEAGVWRKVQFWLGLGLYAGAVGCLILAGVRVQAALSTGVPTMQGLKGIIGLVSMASSLYTLARFLTAWWFPWAMGAVGVATLGWLAYTLWKAKRDEVKAAALRTVRARLDAAYEAAPAEAKAILDVTVFEPLSEDMKKTPGAKTAIHLDRANA